MSFMPFVWRASAALDDLQQAEDACTKGNDAVEGEDVVGLWMFGNQPII